MSKTNYPGIDYGGPGSTVNRDTETGIRYGVIEGRSCSLEAVDDIFTQGDDLGYESAMDELKAKLRGVLEDYFLGDRLTRAVDRAFEAVDGWADNIDGSGPYRYERDGYIIQSERDGGDLWVMKSPFYTYAQFCSPCAPGACHLDNPLDFGDPSPALLKELGVESNKCYCLGHDWFDGGKAPYRMWRVSDNTEVLHE